MHSAAARGRPSRAAVRHSTAGTTPATLSLLWTRRGPVGPVLQTLARGTPGTAGGISTTADGSRATAQLSRAAITAIRTAPGAGMAAATPSRQRRQLARPLARPTARRHRHQALATHLPLTQRVQALNLQALVGLRRQRRDLERRRGPVRLVCPANPQPAALSVAAWQLAPVPFLHKGLLPRQAPVVHLVEPAARATPLGAHNCSPVLARSPVQIKARQDLGAAALLVPVRVHSGRQGGRAHLGGARLRSGNPVAALAARPQGHLQGRARL